MVLYVSYVSCVRDSDPGGADVLILKDRLIHLSKFRRLDHGFARVDNRIIVNTSGQVHLVKTNVGLWELSAGHVSQGYQGALPNGSDACVAKVASRASDQRPCGIWATTFDKVRNCCAISDLAVSGQLAVHSKLWNGLRTEVCADRDVQSFSELFSGQSIRWLFGLVQSD